MSTAEQLASVRTLIAKLETEGVSEVREGSRSWKRMDLSQLYAREEMLLRRLSIEQRAAAGSQFAPVIPADYP